MAKFAPEFVERAQQLIGAIVQGLEYKIPSASIGDEFAAEGFFEFCETVPRMRGVF